MLTFFRFLQGYGVEEGAFCAVFDGHGKNGHTVSKIVRNRLPSLLLSQRNSIAKLGSNGQSKSFQKWKDACISSFKAVDKELQYLETLDCSCSGTTATAVIRQVNETSNLSILVNCASSKVEGNVFPEL